MLVDGKEVSLTPGMAVTVEIETSKRRDYGRCAAVQKMARP